MSYRQSMYPGGAAANLATSNASSLSSTSTGPSPAHSRLVDKQREFTAFSSICSHAHELATFLDEFATRCETLGGGSEGPSPFSSSSTRLPPSTSSTAVTPLVLAPIRSRR